MSGFAPIATTSKSGDASARRRAEAVRKALPEGGLFAEKSWRVSPEPFPLSPEEVRFLERLGPMLLRFQRACDVIYRRSRKGTLPGWIAGYLDRGKPADLIEAGLAGPVAEQVPQVIRPDLILTEEGFAITELDSVPGGMGLTAWLGEVYQGLDPDGRIVGGPEGMIGGFASVFAGAVADAKDPAGGGATAASPGVDIVVSEESSDYRPEMEWLAERLGAGWEVRSAEDYEPRGRDVYRFLELFDWPDLPAARALAESAAKGETRVVSPFKPWLEEKMQAALFWSHPLAPVWRRELREANFERLRKLFPRSWVVHGEEAPHFAAIPGLEIQSFHELADFTQSERELVLKLSGYNERAWGSRSVTVGQDVPQEEWSAAVEEAIAGSEESPWVLQDFHRGKLVEHRWWDETRGSLETMEGRVRLCPYYFVEAGGKKVRLGGVLATICPSDKKVIHGMSDAIIVPCVERG